MIYQVLRGLVVVTMNPQMAIENSSAKPMTTSHGYFSVDSGADEKEIVQLFLNDRYLTNSNGCTTQLMSK